MPPGRNRLSETEFISVSGRNSGQMPSVLTYGTRKALIGSSIKPLLDERRVSLLVLCALALVIGVMTGLGAVVFRALIAFVHNLSYNGRLSFVYNANISEGPSRFRRLCSAVANHRRPDRRLSRQALCP